MEIPDSPEQLLEALSEQSVRELFPSYDELQPRNQSLMKLIHRQLTSGDLTDAVFAEMVVLIFCVWRSFNLSALKSNHSKLDESEEIDETWIDTNEHLTRMDQFLLTSISSLNMMPSPPETDENNPFNQYILNWPE